MQALYGEIEQRFSSLPGVERVALSTYTPLEGDNWSDGVYIQGRPEPRPDDDIVASFLRVSPEYFDTIGHRLLRGREITAQDTATSPPVAVVNETFVKKFFPKGENPIGMHFGRVGRRARMRFEIVGVVSDVKYQPARDPMRAMYFRPLLQVAPISEDGTSARCMRERSCCRRRGQ